MAIFDAKMMCKEATKSGLLGGSSMICKWLITMVIVSPLSRVVGPLPNGRTLWLINGGDPNYVSKSWDDPPSSSTNQTRVITGFLDINPAIAWGVGALFPVTPAKMNSSPLKRNHLKRKVLFQPSLFRGFFIFPGCKYEETLAKNYHSHH